MKINDISNKPPERTEISLRDSGSKKEILKSDFVEEMERLRELSSREKLDTLLGRIDQQAQKMSKNVNIGEVMVYKKLISEFLKESVNSMVKFSKDNFLDRRGRHRIYAIIKRVDQELEELTKDVLKKEKDNLKILKRLDDIRGLILDIYM